MENVTYEAWKAAADRLEFRNDALIDGEFCASESGRTFAAVSPRNGRKLADIACCGEADVNRAVASARRAFEDGRWSRKTPRERKLVLRRFADLIRTHRDEIALLVTLDMGKPIADSTSIDVRATADCYDWYGEAIDKINDEIAPTGDGTVALVTREPLGVVAAVVPWNFPITLAAWKVAPALATGNSVVLKPSEMSTLSGLRVAELGLEAGVPPGVFNVVPGWGPETGRALGMHMDVDGLFFTGSTQVGKYFLEYAAKSNLKRTGLELGGKSPNLILSSYRDIRHAAETSANSAFFNQGEMCTCPSRLVVEDSVYDEVIEVIKERAKAFAPKDPLDPSANMGALVSEDHANAVMKFVEVAVEDGATVSAGGARVLTETGGAYVQPTIFEGVTNDMRVAQQEIFGPMVSVIRVKDVDEAIKVANDTPYGLASAVWTDDLSIAYKVSRSIRAGLCYVNCYDCDDLTTPFGGFKESGIGRDKSLHALDKYTELKTTWMNVAGR